MGISYSAVIQQNQRGVPLQARFPLLDIMYIIGRRNKLTQLNQKINKPWRADSLARFF
jgi:hypothetical protein